MQTQHPITRPGRPDPWRIVNTPPAMMPLRHTPDPEPGFSDPIEQSDPRWIMAARVQVAIMGSIRMHSMEQHQSLIESGARLGLSPMSACAIIGIVEDAQQRGGLDGAAIRELARIPHAGAHAPDLSARCRWIVFGSLIAWSLSIAGLMQLV